MADVAARVGVSRQLVGLVFRGQAGVSSETRERILTAAADLGYSPNISARSLRRVSTRSIGVTFDSSHYTPVDIVESLYSFAHRAGYTLIVSLVNESRDDGAAVAELVGYRCEALILISPRSDLDELQRLAGRTPIVVIGRGSPNAHFSVVRARGDVGIEAVVDHLADLGHRDIAYVHGTAMLEAQLRFDGFLRAVARRGIAERVVHVEGDYTEESGARGAQLLLDSETLPTAVVCNNDQAAMGLAFVLKQAGIAIPGRISVTGYDDNRVARLSFMALTTVRLDPAEVAESAIDAALALITDDTAMPTETLTSAHLIVRQSTAAPFSDSF
jgi:DNA-binding LacI/PurR family transcriptional regulator